MHFHLINNSKATAPDLVLGTESAGGGSNDSKMECGTFTRHHVVKHGDCKIKKATDTRREQHGKE
jgi:hypothetical protein